MDVSREIAEIGRLITSAALIMSVRNEVGKVLKDGFVVTDGRHHPAGEKYEVVVRCGGKEQSEVARRIGTKMPEMEIERISDGVLGLKTARRGGRHG